MNLSAILRVRKDSHDKTSGPVLASDAIVVGGTDDVFRILDSLGGKFFRVLYRTEKGQNWDWSGRTGVWDSSQDGTVQGIGSPMRCPIRKTVSFWTCTYGGKKVNTGAGIGYRTLRADRVLAIVVNGQTILTARGILEIQSNG